MAIHPTCAHLFGPNYGSLGPCLLEMFIHGMPQAISMEKWETSKSEVDSK